MKKITQKQFDKLPVVDGRKQCPTGDYSEIKLFPHECDFGIGCNFGEGCSFGEGCHFGEWCSFGVGCTFERGCSFGEGCRFGEWCSFGDACSFGYACSFGEWCVFGMRCTAISPFWSFVYPPPFKTEGRILPPETAREYWEQRLGMKLEGCYDEIAEQLKPKLKTLLRRKNWTECERRILESWAEEK